MGYTINISYVATNSETLKHLEDYRDIHIDPITKVHWVLVNFLLTMLNATSQYKFHSTWGYKNSSTGLYSGMIGDLQTGKAELGGTPAFFTRDRLDVVDFIPPTTSTRSRFIFRAPRLSYTANIFTLPFDFFVWCSIFILVGIIFIVLYIIVFWECKQPTFDKLRTEMRQSLQANPSDVLLLEVGAISQQGADIEPRSTSGRIATIFTFITFMFLFTSYSANIVALLQSTTESIVSLEDLLTSRLTLGVDDIVYAHYYFEHAEDTIRKAIYQQKVAPKGQKSNFMSVPEGIAKVRQGLFAFHLELSTGYKFIADTFQENEKCDLKEITFYNMVSPYLVLRNGSSYKDIFKVGMVKMMEAGVQLREHSRIYMKKPVCHSTGSNFSSAGLIDCYGAFLIFAIGVACSLIVFFIELVLAQYKTGNKIPCGLRNERRNYDYRKSLEAFNVRRGYRKRLLGILRTIFRMRETDTIQEH